MKNLRRILPRRNTEVDTRQVNTPVRAYMDKNLNGAGQAKVSFLSKCFRPVHGGRKKIYQKLCETPCGTPCYSVVYFMLYIFAINIASLFLLSGCVSIMEWTGHIIDGSAFAQKTIALYRCTDKSVEVSVVENKNGERNIIIAAAKFPMMKIRASMPDEQGIFFLLSLEYLAGNPHGWNEYTLELLGAGSLVLGEDSNRLTIEEIEPVQITAARIHSYDTRITGAEALTALRNRRERIGALAEWMAVMNGPAETDIKEFEKYWKPVLFPEMVSKSKRPEGWLREEDIFIKADDIQWNTGYTQRVFPQELWPVRDSATLLRDWEEALSWIYMEYEWKNIAEIFSREIILQKIK